MRSVGKCILEGSSVEDSVLRFLRPSQIQIYLLNKLFKQIKNILEKCLLSKGIKAKVELQGSFAKGTMLSDKWEIDIFILFINKDKKWIKKNGEKILKSCLIGRMPFITKYAEHPYLTVSLMGLEADIVPISEIIESYSGEKRIGVERTPRHTKWVNTHLSLEQKDEVRLLKSFLKGIGIYGAETHIRGFSGYAAELLIYYYGSFRNVLKAASSWRPRIYIDPLGKGERKKLEKIYRDSVIILVDPVDPSRNVTAAVSRRSLAVLVLASQSYLSTPSPFFFHVCLNRCTPEPHRVPVYLVLVECRGKFYQFPPENVWGKLLRSSSSLFTRLKLDGFVPVYKFIDTDEAGYTKIGVLVLRRFRESWERREGPPPWDSGRVKRFVEKRIRERGMLVIDDNGLFYGIRPRDQITVIESALSWLNSSANRIGKDLGGTCWARLVDCKREMSKWCDPSPAWIKCR